MKTKILILTILITIFCALKINAKDIVTTIDLNAEDIAIDDSSNKIYGVNSSGAEVQVIDGSSDTLSNSILSSSLAPVIAVNSMTGLIYVKKQTMSSFGGPVDTPGIFVLDGNTGIDTGTFIPIEGSIDDIEVDPVSNKIYVIGVLLREGKVRLIDGNTNIIVDTLSIPENANQLSEFAICSKDKAVAIDGPSGTVHILNVDSMNKLSVEGTVTVDNGNAGTSVIACNSLTNKAYVAGTNTNDDTLHVINTANQMLIESIPIDAITFSNGGNSISDIAVDSTKNKIYIAQNDSVQDSIVVLDGESNEFDESTDLGSVSFSEIKVNSSTNKVYVLDGSENILTVINGSLNPSMSSSSSSSTGGTSGSTSSSGGEEEIPISEIRDEGNEFLQVLDLFLSLQEKLDSESRISKVNKINTKLKKILPKLKKLEQKVTALLELESILLGKPINEELQSCSATLKSAVKISEGVISKVETLSCSANIPTCIAEDKINEIVSDGESILRKVENSSTDNNNNGFPDICDYVALMRGIGRN